MASEGKSRRGRDHVAAAARAAGEVPRARRRDGKRPGARGKELRFVTPDDGVVVCECWFVTGIGDAVAPGAQGKSEFRTRPEALAPGSGPASRISSTSVAHQHKAGPVERMTRRRVLHQS